jgi:putative ABC transport system substrate-binding protein
MKTALPRLARVAVLTNPGNPAMVSVLRAMEESASALKVKLWHMEVRRLDELETAFTAAKAQAEALTVIDEGLYIANARTVADLALKHQLPSIGFSEYAEAGGLLANGVNFLHVWRQSMVLVDKIFKDTKPAELPIQQATRFDVIVNLKTAKALGLTIPPSLLARADHVIEYKVSPASRGPPVDVLVSRCATTPRSRRPRLSAREVLNALHADPTQGPGLRKVEGRL